MEKWKDQIEAIFKFHTKRAPGIPIGACMVEYALELLGPVNGTVCAVSETDWCLSDAIQFMTGCTVGNRNLKIEGKLGRYALTFFERETGRGVRVAVDVRKINKEKSPELYKFFHRIRGKEVEAGGPPRKESNMRVIEDFMPLGREILSWEKVEVKEKGKKPIPPANICSKCGESFLSETRTNTCQACLGNIYYTKT